MSDLPQISHGAAGLLVLGEQVDLGQRQRASRTTSSWKWRPRTPRAAHMDIDSVADSRGATINVHYSISLLPQTGYQPRLADDRVGYFLTVVKDCRSKGDDDRFVRYINRWDLQKADPSAELSPPKKPIMFWLEKTIPFAYRKPIRDGISGMEQGVREGRLRQRHRSPPAARQGRLGSGRHQLQHVPLDHGRGRLRHGPLARESEHRADSRRRHHLRRRLHPVLEAGIRKLHARERSPR